MVDAQAEADQNAKALLDWLSTFKGFYNKLELQDADGTKLPFLLKLTCSRWTRSVRLRQSPERMSSV